MDIRLIPGAVATPDERLAVDRAIGGAPPGRRDLLLPALHSLQGRSGWISPGGLNYVCERLNVPPADAFGVASFYAMLSVEPRPSRRIHVCDDIACRGAGSEELCAALERRLGPEGKGAWHRSPCLGQCERAPAALVQAAGEPSREWTLAPANPDAVALALSRGAPSGPTPRPLVPETRGLRLLRRVNRVDPDSLKAYRASGGYAALARALELGSEGVIREVIESRLVGRGGAAFPTGRKWEAVARAQARPHYFVLNADESEPGTFKDRVLMEGDPFAVIEAMTIAGIATGSERGFVYVRGEYPLAAARLSNAVEQAQAEGLLGGNVLGSGLRFDVELRRGAGAYICGEETALFNSIEGFRGEPRQKPPYPVEAGLFGKPTAINNVETLVNVLEIVQGGGRAFASMGSGSSTGTKLLCVSGAVARPGLYELPFGATLRELLGLAGVSDSVQAVLLGGAAGTFVTPAEFGVPLTFEGTRAIGASLGSGVVLAFDARTDWPGLLLRIAAFFRDESCGQCVPCRVGTVRQEEALRRLASAQTLGTRETEHELLDEVGQVMRDASICGLGQTASSAVASAIKKLGLFGGGSPS
jgi:NADH-quinone oxidoreductase subunit F